MNIYLLVLLRIIHIFAGLLWVGSAVLYLFFVEPAVKSIGIAGPQFMQNFIGRQRYPIYMGVVSILTVLSGVFLFLNISGGFKLVWIRTGPGLGFTFGSLVGTLVFFYGFFIIKPRGERLAALSEEIGRNGGTPTPEQATALHKLDQELVFTERVDFVLLTISTLAMATARYWAFSI